MKKNSQTNIFISTNELQTVENSLIIGMRNNFSKISPCIFQLSYKYKGPIQSLIFLFITSPGFSIFTLQITSTMLNKQVQEWTDLPADILTRILQHLI